MSPTKAQENKLRYELPEEQQKVGDDVDGEDSLPSILEEAEEMTEEMMEISYRTNSDGTVEGIVKKIHYTKSNGSIAVDIDLPARADLWRKHFRKPKSWTREWEFVRFVESYGHYASSVTSMIEDGVKVKVKIEDGEPELVIPKTWKDYYHKLRFFYKGMSEIDHPIWKAIPVGTGLGVWAAFVLSPPETTITSPTLEFMFSILVGGLAGFLIALGVGILVAVSGSFLFGWDID